MTLRSKKSQFKKTQNHTSSHPYDLIQEEEELYDENSWLSEKIKEEIESNIEMLSEKIREGARRKSNLISIKNTPRYFDRAELDSHLNKKKDLKKQNEISIDHLNNNIVDIVDVSELSLLDIFNGKIFNDESLKIFSNYSVNFDFPEVLPLPRIPILDNENVRYIDIIPEFIDLAITVGSHVKNGVTTRHKTYIPINKLPQNMVIFGKSGSGKTYFLARFIKELSQKAKKVGILVLNVAKASQ